MKKIKKRIILGVIITIWIILICFFAIENKKIELQKEPQYLFINNLFFWKYENGNWEELDKYKDNELFNWKKFDLFLNNKYINTYNYVNNDGLPYFFNDNNESQEIIENNLILLNKDTYFKMIDFTEVTLNEDDEKFINKILKKNNINFSDIGVKIKYLIDENNFVYVLSNKSNNVASEDTFYLFIYKTKYRSYVIANKKFNYDYSLQSVINIGNKRPNFILKYKCYNNYCYDMYQYVDKSYEKITGLEFDE